jgi:pilus assembly protein CpaE
MPGSTLLVIDGDPTSRSYIASVLEKEGHRVLQAGLGKEGLIFAWRDHPDLIIVEPALPDLSGEELAGRLRSDVRTAKTALVAFGRDASLGRVQSCKQAGFNEYLVKGPEAIPALVATVSMLLRGEQLASKEGGLLVAFLSAKGGAGTSSLCANLAWNIAEQQKEARVVVADLVLPIGSIAGIVGYREAQNIGSVASMPAAETTAPFLRNRLPLIEEWHFHLLAGSPDPQCANELNVGRIDELMAGLKAAYDYVLIDLGRSLSRISLPVIEEADLVVMVVGADMSTVALTRTVWDYLQTKQVPVGRVFAILNRAVGLEGLTKAEIEQALGMPVKVSVPYLAGNFSMANNQHQPYPVKFPRDTASIAFKDIAQQMVEAAKRVRAG